LPNGEFEVWKFFLQNGEYFWVTCPAEGGKQPKVNSILLNKQQHVLAFIYPRLWPTKENSWGRGWKNPQVQFHNWVKLLREAFGDVP
jgi:hypothetical protein